MAGSEESQLSSLAEKLAALEKKIAELEKKSNQSPVNEKLPQKDEGEEKEGNATMNSSLTKMSETTQQDEKEHEPESRVKVIINKIDPETGEPIEDTKSLKKDKDSDLDGKAFIMRKNISESKMSLEEDSSEIDIIDTNFWELLKEKLGNYPYHIFRGSPVTLHSPYEALVFNYDNLRMEAAKPSQDEKTQRAHEDLTLLLNVISGGSSGDQRLDKYFKMRSSYVEQSTIQFVDLWTAFPPGTLLYGRPFQNEHQVFIVKDNHRPWPSRDEQGRGSGREWQRWELDAWSYDWKDGSFQRTLFTLIFEPFEGHLPLISLPYYPFRLHSRYDDVAQELVARGKKFRAVCEAKQSERLFNYEGRTILEKKGFIGMKPDDEDGGSFDSHSDPFRDLFGVRRTMTSMPPVQSSDIRSRVMVDYESYYQYGGADGRNGDLRSSRMSSDCACSDCGDNEALKRIYRTTFDEVAHQKQIEWEEEQYLICPPRVLGYILQEKQWAQLQVSKLEEIESLNSNDAWHSRLKLADDDDDEKGSKGSPSTKNLLLDLVRSHTPTTATTDREREGTLEVDDIIPGKGKGLIILLYGPPGVGKTSTAETIAIATRKPLFSVSVADVGTKAKNVESNLSRIFALATKWQAILLIDEADVFLESRGRGNAVRSTDKNALVSVFLRVLEYYQGIMFLTTNQIAEFDIAIPSRIHIAIKFTTLEKKQMRAIFHGFLDKLHKHQLIEDYEEITAWLDEVVYQEGFDGRQIRNLVTTALGLARAENKYPEQGGKLCKKHLRRAFTNTSLFKRDFNTQMQRYIDSQHKMIK